MKSLDLFRSGLNTYEISQKLHKPEHEVSRAIYMARCNEKGLEIRTQKSPYALKLTGKPYTGKNPGRVWKSHD